MQMLLAMFIDVMNLFYFNCSSGDLSSTSSQICGSWYLPIFLLRDGSLTLISIASLIVLVILWSSMPTMLKLSRTLHDQWSCNGHIWVMVTSDAP